MPTTVNLDFPYLPTNGTAAPNPYWCEPCPRCGYQFDGALLTTFIDTSSEVVSKFEKEAKKKDEPPPTWQKFARRLCRSRAIKARYGA